ncbi:hypothetical protein LX32DRAFT_673789 [Colletotrichum zoysiae]|uniref:Uncharacterized protein n=1 Tax=Colletotrichum zoysiae TaxID=1216348 RepID=A0AAD9M3Q6_9PEZI|nr:hypothetical protein LX32DRAFT_673789 [Colletotrichum zoysiae]
MAPRSPSGWDIEVSLLPRQGACEEAKHHLQLRMDGCGEQAGGTAAPSSSSSTDPVADDDSTAATTAGSTSTRTLVIISTVLGTAFFLAIAVAAYFVATRRRQRRLFAEDYKNACLRDPDLTWDEYARRTKLSQSRIMLAEEELRDTIIRKSLQNRTSITVNTVGGGGGPPGSPDAAAAAETPVSPPARARSRIWHHGRSRSKSSIEAEEGEGLLMSVRSDWVEHEARVEKTWELLHKKYPTRRLALPADEDSAGGPARPPTIRLKTPPLLSHPMFRGWNAEGPARHSSLPTELARMKPAQI